VTAPTRFVAKPVRAVQHVGGSSGQLHAAAAPKPAPGGVSRRDTPRGVGRAAGVAQAVSR
jgi:hypothetical protein